MTSRASRKVASPRVVCIEDLRPLARRRVPKAVFDYLDGGAEGEVTLRENCRAFEDVTFRPRHAVSISDCDLRTRVLGFDLSPPFLHYLPLWEIRERLETLTSRETEVFALVVTGMLNQQIASALGVGRSEERRVGKECRSRW